MKQHPAERWGREVPPADVCVLPQILARRAAQTPERTFIVFENRSSWTWKQAHEAALRTASALWKMGVRKGDRVICWAPDGKEVVQTWFGTNHLGAIYVPLNTALRGAMLQHVVANANARVAVVHADLLDRLRGLDLGGIERIVVLSGTAGGLHGVQFHEPAELFEGECDEQILQSPSDPWDPYAIIYTSGTTGPSKGVLCSYLQIWATGALSLGPLIHADDRVLLTLPLYHTGGTVGIVTAATEGASVAIPGRFATNAFWRVIREFKVTCCTLLGVMATFLLKQPERSDDADSPLRLVTLIPLTEDAQRFAQRFGCDVFTAFNMTELSTPIVSEINPSTVGACGCQRPGLEVRLVDEHDCDVAPDAVGEMIVRTDMPWTLNSGYWGNPEATAAAWRNGWFHTGDAFRRDAAGNYFFVDRLKDTIRRRGENISSFEVEAELLAHPDVQEAGAVAVASEFGEDEVLAVIAPRPGARIEPEQLLKFLIERMPYYMVPRYIRVLNELPKTHTNKVEKYVLRSAGLTADTWDRERAGIEVRRERFS